MHTKVSLCFLAVLVFLTSSVVGMDPVQTPKKRLCHSFQTPGDNEYFTPEQRSMEEKTAFNRAQADRANESEFEEEDESSLEQRGGTARISESAHEDAAQQAVGDAQKSQRKLFQTPVQKVREAREIQSEPALKRKKASQPDEMVFLRKQQMARGDAPLDVHELERIAWLCDGKEVKTFSETKKELARWIDQKNEEREKKLEEEIEDPQKIKAVRKAFVTSLEQCYGEDFTNELFAEGEKEKFLEQQEPLSLADAAGLIALADAGMEEGRSYLPKCEGAAALVQEALDAFNVAQEEARRAQEDYDALEGSPFQHGIAALWCATRTAMGIVSAGTVIVLVVVYHHSMPIVMAVGGSVVGYIRLLSKLIMRPPYCRKQRLS